MKKIAIFLCILMACTSLPACSPAEDDPVPPPKQEEQTGNDSTNVSDGQETNPKDSIPETPIPNDSIPNENQPEEGNDDEKEEIMEKNKIKLTVNGKSFTATLEENSSAEALCELLEKGDLNIRMSDYGDMEKVGSLGTSLPRNDRQTTTQPGDLILYLGNSFVIYYDTNSWNFTRLGRLDGVSTRQEVLELLGGKGDITVTLSIK